MNIKKEGSVTFWLRHEHSDWTTNSNRYDFGNLGTEHISVSARKYPDLTLEIDIDGPFDKGFVFTTPIPKCDKRGLAVGLSWAKKAVSLYLNGEFVGTIKA